VEYQAAKEANPMADVRAIPESIVKLMGTKKRIYRIKYLTQAAIEAQTESIKAIMDTWQFAMSVGQANPRAIQVLDAEGSVKAIAEARGAPKDIFLSEEDLKAQDDSMAEQAQSQEMMMKMAGGAAIAKDVSTAKMNSEKTK
jgi:hypothetical protein